MKQEGWKTSLRGQRGSDSCEMKDSMSKTTVLCAPGFWAMVSPMPVHSWFLVDVSIHSLIRTAMGPRGRESWKRPVWLPERFKPSLISREEYRIAEISRETSEARDF